MALFMLKCTKCDSERQSPKLDTNICPDCGAVRETLAAQLPNESSRPPMKINADTVSPNLEELRDRLRRQGRLTGQHKAVKRPAANSPDEHDVWVTVEYTNMGKKIVVMDPNGNIIAAQG